MSVADGVVDGVVVTVPERDGVGVIVGNVGVGVAVTVRVEDGDGVALAVCDGDAPGDSDDVGEGVPEHAGPFSVYAVTLSAA